MPFSHRPRTTLNTTPPMKNALKILLALVCVCLLPSCASTEAARQEQAAQIARTAVTVAELSGKLTPQQVAILRKGQVLLLDSLDGEQPELARLSELAVEIALERKAITPEQAALLQVAGAVAMNRAPGLIPAP